MAPRRSRDKDSADADLPTGDPDVVIERIRLTIARMDEQRRLATTNAGAALVNQAEAVAAVTRQRAELEAAAAEIAQSVQTAEAAGDRAGAEADAAGLDEAAAAAARRPYDDTASSLRSAAQVVTTALGQLDGLDDAARTNLAQSRVLLLRTRRSLDDAVREQVALLVRLERARRRQVIAAARRTSDAAHRSAGPEA